ncbi:saccharopine reductase [Luteitalea sp. TBR-22]|uniref:saccharopine dehydrogenase family protein n=1 Tax=Luteitalea sp. TBR-22 TaxID=2802971 RepID=UPI001AFA8B9A|nr:saccharopine dehydrogenase C-terminal domain-containing protein [Luteitalea sp. TBR-22]BCS31084.1 saccharopine reductase [Luteitalea sp. TBR-22]
MRVVVFGAGVVGEAVAWDLTHVPPTADVTVVDVDAARLQVIAARLRVAAQQADLSDIGVVRRLADAADVTVGTLPSTLARPVIAAMARDGRRHVDVSFLAEDPREDHEAARTAGAVVVYDCGVAPGLSHALIGHAARTMTRVRRGVIDVGGLPVDPEPPFFYKAPFAPGDVIEEYTRPARLVRDGHPVTLPALSEAVTVEVPGVGLLEAFNTDGLRSLVDTVPADAMIERTLRYPGHLAAMRVLADGGFFDPEPRPVGGHLVSPRALTEAVLFPQWQYAPGERDMTVLRVEVEGEGPDGPVGLRWTMVDRPGTSSPLSSMARTTGMPAAITCRWIASGLVSTPGVHPPERLGLDGHAPALLDALAARGIHVVAD